MSFHTTHPPADATRRTPAHFSSPPADADGALPIRGVLLRSVLLLELDRARRRSLTVGELCDAVRRHGFTVRGRMGKVISDALRCEIIRGRVRRPARGRYRIERLPTTTRWRCRRRVAAGRAGAAPPWHLHSVDDATVTGRPIGRRPDDDPTAPWASPLGPLSPRGGTAVTEPP